MPREAFTFDHHKTRHHGVADGPEQGVVACWPCHTWLQQKPKWRNALYADQGANAINGKVLRLTEEMEQSRQKFVLGFTGRPAPPRIS